MSLRPQTQYHQKAAFSRRHQDTVSRSRRQSLHGFTLMELLVVISIIALLLSILAPSLGLVKERARRTICGSNLKQMVLAGIMYAQDHNGRFIYKESGGTWQPHIWWELHKSANFDYRVFFEGYLDGYKLKKRGVWTKGYDHAPKAMFCPSAITKELGYGKTWPYSPTSSWAPFQTSYQYFNLGFYENIRNQASWLSFAKMPLTATAKSSTPLFGDLMEYRDLDGGFWRAANHFKNGFKEWDYEGEPEGMNSACVDGSVRWYKYDSETEVYWGMRGGSVTIPTDYVWGKP